MADVETRDSGRSKRSTAAERGQLILVAGLTIAVILVALVLLLNTVIYTENLATRGVDVGGADAIEYRGAVIDGVGELLDEENQRGNDDVSIATLREGINATDDALSDRYLQRGVIAEINRSSVTETTGIRVVQNESDSFNSSTGNATWEVATDVSHARQFVMEVDTATNTTAENASDGFHINVTAGGDRWNVYVYTNESTGNLSVATGDPGAIVERCSVSAPATIDLTGGTLDGTTCAGVNWAESIDSPYTISFENGTDVTGTYELTTDGDPGDQLNDTSGDGPFYHDAVYSVTVGINYQSTDLAFNTYVRIAPGEPNG